MRAEQSRAEQTGFPSIDKPWLKYYNQESFNVENLPECSLFKYLYENNQHNLDTTALNFFGNKMTYRQMFEEIDHTAKAFLQLGIKPGDVVAVVSISCVQSVLCFYALNKIGAISNYLSVLSSEDEIKKFILEGNSQVVVSADLFGKKVLNAVHDTNVRNVITFSLSDYMPIMIKPFFKLKARNMDKSFMKNPLVLDWNLFIKAGKVCGEVNGAYDCKSDVCFYGHTGGTTGFPKSVILTNRSFNSVVWQYISTFPHDKGEVFLNLIPPFVTYGAMINMHMPLCLGLELVLIPKFDPDEWLTYFRKYRPEHIIAIPAYIAAMLDNNKLRNQDLSFVKTLAMGGEGMNIPLEKKVNQFLDEHNSRAKVMKGYGMTEVCATASTEQHNVIKMGSVGVPFIMNNFMAYDNENQKELSYNQTGEICMQCVSTMVGYKENQKETDNLIKEHADGSRWIHTGDLGYIDEDGFIFIEGRMKRMIITVKDGIVYKIVPTQIEEVINNNMHVRECCVVGHKFGKDNGLKAFVIKADDISDEILEKELRKWCGDKLGENQQPNAYAIVNEFPRTAAGKVDYRRIEKMK